MSDTAKDQPKKDKPKKKAWGVLVYMVADDPQGGEALDQVAHRELDRITHGAMGANLDRMHVAVQVDFRSQPFVWRRIVARESWTQPETQSANAESLYGFFDWARQNCPAERYMLILWGHSNGPFGFFNDDDSGAYVAQTLTIVELRKALRSAKDSIGRKIDILAFKDCFIGTMEIAYELRGLVDYLVTSQGLIPAEDWPYREMFSALPAKPTKPRVLLAAKAVHEALEDFYEVEGNRGGKKADVPISLLDTQKATGAVEEFGKLVHSLTETRTSRKLTAAVKKALASSSAGDAAMVDVRRFCGQIQRLSNNLVKRPKGEPPDPAATALRDAKRYATTLDAAITQDLVVRHASKVDSRKRRDPRTYTGVSVFWFPSSSKAAKTSKVAWVASRRVYSELELNRETKWAQIALESMATEAIGRISIQDVGRESIDGGALVYGLLWEQLQRSGRIEQMQLDWLMLAQNTILGLSTLGPKDKGGNLGPKDKGGNLGPKDKGGNLGPVAFGSPK
jgi:Clostripain family